MLKVNFFKASAVDAKAEVSKAFDPGQKEAFNPIGGGETKDPKEAIKVDKVSKENITEGPKGDLTFPKASEGKKTIAASSEFQVSGDKVDGAHVGSGETKMPEIKNGIEHAKVDMPITKGEEEKLLQPKGEVAFPSEDIKIVEDKKIAGEFMCDKEEGGLIAKPKGYPVSTTAEQVKSPDANIGKGEKAEGVHKQFSINWIKQSSVENAAVISEALTEIEELAGIVAVRASVKSEASKFAKLIKAFKLMRIAYEDEGATALLATEEIKVPGAGFEVKEQIPSTPREAAEDFMADYKNDAKGAMSRLLSAAQKHGISQEELASKLAEHGIEIQASDKEIFG